MTLFIGLESRFGSADELSCFVFSDSIGFSLTTASRGEDQSELPRLGVRMVSEMVRWRKGDLALDASRVRG